MTNLILIAFVLYQAGIASAQALSDVSTVALSDLTSPTSLGAPYGPAVATASFDESSFRSSKLALAKLKTDIPFLAHLSAAPTATAVPEKRSKSKILHRAARDLAARDIEYPIDTSATITPDGYSLEFQGLNAATQSLGYITYQTLSTYDTTECAMKCSTLTSCVFFNIYYEKDPDASYNPIDVIKCAFYSSPQTEATAKNSGQYRHNGDKSFHVIITGSNGYSRDRPLVAPPGTTVQAANGIFYPVPENNYLEDSEGYETFLGYVDLDVYDIGICAAVCAEYNLDNECGDLGCVFANLAQFADEDGVVDEIVCLLLSQYWGPENVAEFDFVQDSVSIYNATAAAVFPLPCTD